MACYRFNIIEEYNIPKCFGAIWLVGLLIWFPKFATAQNQTSAFDSTTLQKFTNIYIAQKEFVHSPESKIDSLLNLAQVSKEEYSNLIMGRPLTNTKRSNVLANLQTLIATEKEKEKQFAVLNTNVLCEQAQLNPDVYWQLMEYYHTDHHFQQLFRPYFAITFSNQKKR